MKTLITYATKYGTTKKCAEKIAQNLPQGADLFMIEKGVTVTLHAYDLVVIGTPIYMGRPLKAVKSFCKRHMDELLARRVALYMCCIQDQEKSVNDQFALAFPQALRKKALAMALLGGEVHPESLKWIDGLIMKAVTSSQPKELRMKPVSSLSEERFARFAEVLLGSGA
ncbi:MAG: flavodoxin domain-containing protein [Clostridia bacterium]|nr:flavodoxin domain-containing protein [Clostridia bacterium]